MNTVRPYREADREAVRNICILTSSLPVKTARQRGVLLSQYCDYYIDCEASHCFVAVNERDVPVGYILCAPDYAAYEQRFVSTYLPRIARLHPVAAVAAWFEVRGQRPLARQYPAHMHIDILPRYQRMGLGHQLVDALAAHCREQAVPALFLSVGQGNEKGVRFYHKYGFHEIKRLPGSITMGLSLY